MKKVVLVFLLTIGQFYAQTSDEKQIRTIFDTALTNGMSYDWLNHLSTRIGGRLSGSVQAEMAVDYTKKQLETLGLDKVWLHIWRLAQE